MNNNLQVLTLTSLLLLSACNSTEPSEPQPELVQQPERSIVGTHEPFASENVYFLMTDRFVDGDQSNNYPEQGGDYPTWMAEMVAENGTDKAYVGYMGGDFKGIVDNAGYIRDMGFTAIWLTPIVNNPDQAFSGGEPINFGGAFRDGGKTGYHGYWGVNFYELDEHLPSEGLDFAAYVATLENDFGIRTILDVVLNHGSPSFTMPEDQPMYGELYDKSGKLVADHSNTHPTELSDDNPLHQMFNRKPDLLQLSDFNENEPMVLDYFIPAYQQWLDQGAHAIRIDTIKHMPIEFWQEFARRIREGRDELFMFAEAFDYNPEFIGRYTQTENGKISVLDFPLRQALADVFQDPNGDLQKVADALYLTDGPYENPYDLMTFYDNHDMARINTDTRGYINLHNLLFTLRGIPVVYYGSESGFMSGTAEHAGNRNYYGVEGIEAAKQSPIHAELTKIAQIRKSNVALQRGIQLNLEFAKHQAAFLRVYEHAGTNQTALVLYNKDDVDSDIVIEDVLSSGSWTEALTGKMLAVEAGKTHRFKLPANSIQVWLLNDANTNVNILEQL